MWDIVLPPPQDPKTCYEQPKHVIAIILGLAIVFGQFIAFAPQLISIIVKKHVEGINLLTYLLGTVSCTAVFLSGLMESWTNLFCCRVIVTVNWMNYFMIFVLLAVYVKNTVHQPRAKMKFRLSLAVYLAWGVLGFSLITFAFLLVEGDPTTAPHTSGIYNKVLGLTGTISIILQWSPQIVTTFMHKGPGALSPITLSINSPGSMLTAISLIAAGKSFSLWLPYVLSGAQQAVIVGLILYFYCTRSKKDPIQDMVEHDPGFQGPALLLADSDSDEDNNNPEEDYDGLAGSAYEEEGEEVGTEDELSSGSLHLQQSASDRERLIPSTTSANNRRNRRILPNADDVGASSVGDEESNSLI